MRTHHWDHRAERLLPRKAHVLRHEVYQQRPNQILLPLPLLLQLGALRLGILHQALRRAWTPPAQFRSPRVCPAGVLQAGRTPE